jgi:glycosyltransferase involved in cell wall biosynthesis
VALIPLAFKQGGLMHIGFDISQTGSGKAGCGYFTHAMIETMIALAPEYDYALYPSFGDYFFDPRMPARSPYAGRKVRYGPRHLTKNSADTFWAKSNLEAILGTPDIIHSNNFWSPVQLGSSRLVYTLFDIGFLANPDWTTEANRIGCFNGVFRSAIAAEWVVAISEFSRSQYLELFPHFPGDRVRVVHPCSRFVDSTLEGSPPAALQTVAPNEFWLSVGTIEPRKNQRMLVQAYANYLQAGGSPMPLVMAGGKGWLMDDFNRHVAELGLSDQVVLTGYITDDEMIWLYRNCYANLYPSLFEGFGLPVLEGMQFGAPTVCSNSTSMPEVTGDAAILLSPLETEAWTQAMLELALDPGKRQRLALAARQRAGQFDRKRSASAMLALYREAMGVPKRSHMNDIATRSRTTA